MLNRGEQKSPPAASGSPARQEVMGGLAKGLAILEAFSPLRPRLTVTEASQASGTTPAAARRCLLTLMELGYLSHDGKYYTPTPRVMRLTAAWTATAVLPSLAQPRLVAVRDELGQSASLAVLEGGQSLFVARAEATRIVSAGVRLGATLPLLGSATGRILLSGWPNEQVEELIATAPVERKTPRTVVDPVELLARVEEARREGVAYTDEELDLGVRTMAVPVRDIAGVLHGAMSVSAFAAQVSIAKMRKEYWPVLDREAKRLGRML
ncbi:IclR family transcriptional regulator domain-containing protein [Streptomyces sp. T028]|uniref:IclR family transcriptional regulator domain-containing protein n=1 Tax=Streptomyces sp. T028 TaxID=3394379 RepID=UPI003A83FC6E